MSDDDGAATPRHPRLWHPGGAAGDRRFLEVGELRTEFGGVLPEVTVAYESWGTLNADGDNAILVEVALDGIPAPRHRILGQLRRTTEAVGELSLRPVGDVGDLAGVAHSGQREHRRVIVATTERRVVPDGEELWTGPGDLVGGGVCRRGQDDGAADPVGVAHGPLQGAHSAHGPAENRSPAAR